MLKDYFANQSYAIIAGYCDNKIVALIGGILFNKEGMVIIFPKANPYSVGQKITIHLDSRVGVEEFDINLRVYRSSVKAIVTKVEERRISVILEDYELFYSNNVVDSYRKEGYRFPVDNRSSITLPESTIDPVIDTDPVIQRNKLGVLITSAPDRPHTTVMAFLSTKQDDIFIISQKGSFKSHNLHRDRNVAFAIDHRPEFTFDKAIEWNYSIIIGELFKISPSNPAFSSIQYEFVDKNPWETAFFTDPSIEMFHIKAVELLCPEKLYK
ncbi:hypothetical protein [Spirochaeta cellobiosiphila]|uniref:hypothetical protein n=1 Tax=Spirochaeta cellobiosiphila TaxID=504483 RepID=UPI000402BEB1|nr:hypothetical protein [Spirochaeta cellobiosiphila]